MKIIPRLKSRVLLAIILEKRYNKILVVADRVSIPDVVLSSSRLEAPYGDLVPVRRTKPRSNRSPGPKIPEKSKSYLRERDRDVERNDNNMLDQITPIPSVEWQMLDWCNYKCEYCCVGIPNRKPTENSFMSDALVAKTLHTLEQLPGRWRIHFSGGEPTLHPLFIDACAHLVSKGHSVSLLTNFSARMKTFKELIDKCGVGLEEIEISLHLPQVDLSEFTAKLTDLISMKLPSTKVTVYSVMIAENFQVLKQLPERFGRLEVHFHFQHLKSAKKFVEYPPEVEQYLEGKVCSVIPLLRGKNFHGVMCHTGHLFSFILPNGHCVRCGQLPFSASYLGSVESGSLRLYDEARPCPGSYCLCLRPPLLGMVRYGSSSSKIRQAAGRFRSALPTLCMASQLAITDPRKLLTKLARRLIRIGT